MTDVSFDGLKQEYTDLLAGAEVRPNWIAAVDRAARQILAGKEHYVAVQKLTGVPWQFIGAVHSLEGSCNFNTHLHNGDSLGGRTYHVPAGRPLASPANGSRYTWEESALDALRLKGLHLIKDWSPERVCFELERYNGFGYQLYHHDVNSPYLWSGTTKYRAGKYTYDGHWDSSHVSQQVGAIAILQRLDVLESTYLMRKWLKQNSVKMSITGWVRKAITAIGAIFTGGNLLLAKETIEQLKGIASDYWMPTLLVTGVGIWFIMRWLEVKQVQDAQAGNYQPSKLPEQRDAGIGSDYVQPTPPEPTQATPEAAQ